MAPVLSKSLELEREMLRTNVNLAQQRKPLWEVCLDSHLQLAAKASRGKNGGNGEVLWNRTPDGRTLLAVL
jgi:hypothetical protein